MLHSTPCGLPTFSRGAQPWTRTFPWAHPSAAIPATASNPDVWKSLDLRPQVARGFPRPREFHSDFVLSRPRKFPIKPLACVFALGLLAFAGVFSLEPKKNPDASPAFLGLLLAGSLRKKLEEQIDQQDQQVGAEILGRLRALDFSRRAETAQELAQAWSRAEAALRETKVAGRQDFLRAWLRSWREAPSSTLFEQIDQFLLFHKILARASSRGSDLARWRFQRQERGFALVDDKRSVMVVAQSLAFSGSKSRVPGILAEARLQHNSAMAAGCRGYEYHILEGEGQVELRLGLGRLWGSFPGKFCLHTDLGVSLIRQQIKRKLQELGSFPNFLKAFAEATIGSLAIDAALEEEKWLQHCHDLLQLPPPALRALIEIAAWEDVSLSAKFFRLFYESKMSSDLEKVLDVYAVSREIPLRDPDASLRKIVDWTWRKNHVNKGNFNGWMFCVKKLRELFLGGQPWQAAEIEPQLQVQHWWDAPRGEFVRRDFCPDYWAEYPDREVVAEYKSLLNAKDRKKKGDIEQVFLQAEIYAAYLREARDGVKPRVMEYYFLRELDSEVRMRLCEIFASLDLKIFLVDGEGGEKRIY